jgi:hypothetical protein
MLSITRGQRKTAAPPGFVEGTIQVVAISQVFANLNSLWSILAYSGGFAVGTLTAKSRWEHCRSLSPRLPTGLISQLPCAARVMAEPNCQLWVDEVRPHWQVWSCHGAS